MSGQYVIAWNGGPTFGALNVAYRQRLPRAGATVGTDARRRPWARNAGISDIHRQSHVSLLVGESSGSIVGEWRFDPKVLQEKSVAQVFGVPVKEIGKTSRGRANVALARQVAMYIDHIACGDTMTQVGELFARDRTTVAHACVVIEDRRDDPMFDRVLDLLERVVRSLADPRPTRIAPT